MKASHLTELAQEESSMKTIAISIAIAAVTAICLIPVAIALWNGVAAVRVWLS